MSQFLGFGDGHDGDISSASGVINTYASMTGTAGSATVTTALSVNVGDLVVLHQTQGTNHDQWEKVIVIATGGGSFTAHKELDNTYGAGAQAILVPQYQGGTTANDLSAGQWDGSVGGFLILAGAGKIILGSGKDLIIDYAGFRGGIGGNYATNDPGGGHGGAPEEDRESYRAGEGESGVNGSAGRGGGGKSGGGNAGGGGGGGYGTAGGDGVNHTEGHGGPVDGVATLTSIQFGPGGGGGGKAPHNTPNDDGGDGGDGAGSFMAFVRELDISAAYIYGRGAQGEDIGNGDDECGGGGGGPGGSALIKAMKAILGTNRIVLTGGRGGYGSAHYKGSPNNFEDGGPGGNGRARIEACEVTGSANSPTPSYDTGGHDWCAIKKAIL